MLLASTNDADVELLQRLAGGDGGAIGLLYDRYAKVLLPLALRIVRDRAEAEDVVHDAFVVVSDRAAQYVADRGSVGAWLVTLVRNLSIDRTRRRDRRGTLVRKVLAHEPVDKVPVDPEGLTADAAEHEQGPARPRLLARRAARDAAHRLLRGPQLSRDRPAGGGAARDHQVARGAGARLPARGAGEGRDMTVEHEEHAVTRRAVPGPSLYWSARRPRGRRARRSASSTATPSTAGATCT